MRARTRAHERTHTLVRTHAVRARSYRWAPACMARSQSLRAFRSGKLRAQWTESVNTRGSDCQIGAARKHMRACAQEAPARERTDTRIHARTHARTNTHARAHLQDRGGAVALMHV